MKKFSALLALLLLGAGTLAAEIENEGVFGAAFVGVSTDASHRIVNQVGPLADFAVPKALAARAEKRTLQEGESSPLKADLVLDDGTVTNLSPAEVSWTAPGDAVAIENHLATAVKVSGRMSVSLQASAHGMSATLFIRLKPGEDPSAATAGLPPALSGSADLGQGGWLHSPWFGNFFRGNENWLHHGSHGWLFTVPGQGNSMWMWNPRQRWLWTSPSIYPHLYRNKDGSWLYFVAYGPSLRFYYNQTTNAYEQALP